MLVVGCGNSELSEQLYDVGYHQLTNIDISETVVSHMNQRNAERRPDLSFQQLDATQTGFESGSFQAALDKGTLDAMASEEDGALASRMLGEVGRVLAVGGRYVCVTLAQEHVIKLAVEHFAQGWAVRIHCLSQQQKEESDSSFALPVFVLVCTKFRQVPPFAVLELCQGEDGAPTRLASVPELLSAVKERQAYNLMLHKLRGETDASSTPSLTLCHAATGRPRYTLTVQIACLLPSCHGVITSPSLSVSIWFFCLFIVKITVTGQVYLAIYRVQQLDSGSKNHIHFLHS